MADPAILALLEHLNWSPPAIVQPAPVEATDPKLAAYAAYVSRQEEALASWIKQGILLRAHLWQTVTSDASGLARDELEKIIFQFEHELKQEAISLARKERQARRDEKGLRAGTREFVALQHTRLLTMARSFYAEGRDLAAFLRALKAELDPGSRGGLGFDDPTALEKHLLEGSA